MGKLQRELAEGLTLYVRQMAWFNATPKPAEGSKREKAGRAATLTRRDQFKKDGVDPPMPPNPMPSVITRLIEIGLTSSTGMDRTALTWAEINQWKAATGFALSSWEARMIRQLSAAYIVEGRKAESENCPAPWKWKMTQRERDMDLARLELALG